MIEIKTRLRKWGNSLGLVLPQKSLMGLEEGCEITIFIEPIRTDLRKLFGKKKLKKSTEEIMREIDAELEYE